MQWKSNNANIELYLTSDEEDCNEQRIGTPANKVLEKNITKDDVPPTKSNTPKPSKSVSKEHITKNPLQKVEGEIEKTKKQNIELKDPKEVNGT